MTSTTTRELALDQARRLGTAQALLAQCSRHIAATSPDPDLLRLIETALREQVGDDKVHGTAKTGFYL